MVTLTAVARCRASRMPAYYGTCDWHFTDADSDTVWKAAEDHQGSKRKASENTGHPVTVTWTA